MSYSFTFNGVRKNYLYCDDEGKKYTVFAPVTRNLLTFPGKVGAYLESTVTNVRVIEQPIFFRGINKAELKSLEEEITGWLLTEKPVSLIFDDEPERTYFAVVDGSLDVEELLHVGQGTITFVCPDPYKYGPEIEAFFLSDVVSITNNGTAKANPVIELEVLAPITFAMIQNQNGEYMMIGRPVDVESNAPYKEYELILNENMSSLTGWTTAASGEIDGEVTGSTGSNGSRFQPESFGSGSGWHGPAVKTSISEPLTDFRLETTIGLWNATPNIVGRAEVYLLDVNGQTVGKVSMKDTQNGRALTWGEARIGDSEIGYHMINEYGNVPGNWNDFFGILRLERRGNEWYAYIAMVNQETGEHHTRRSVYWTDTDNQLTRSVAQVVVHFGQHGSYTTGAMGNYDVKVYKINQDPEGIPYIANEGDVITFNMKDKVVTINGEPRKDLKQFGASYFGLEPGENILTALGGNFDINARYREPFK